MEYYIACKFMFWGLFNFVKKDNKMSSDEIFNIYKHNTEKILKSKLKYL